MLRLPSQTNRGGKALWPLVFCKCGRLSTQWPAKPSVPALPIQARPSGQKRPRQHGMRQRFQAAPRPRPSARWWARPQGRKSPYYEIDPAGFDGIDKSGCLFSVALSPGGAAAVQPHKRKATNKPQQLRRNHPHGKHPKPGLPQQPHPAVASLRYNYQIRIAIRINHAHFTPLTH